MKTHIVSVSDKTLKNQFITFPFELYANDAYWIPPLLQERREFLDPKKNPFFTFADVALFLAMRDDKIVGRVSAQINRLHNERYKEKTAHFGLFESINNDEVAQSLLKAAGDWAIARGMDKMVGPYSMSINEEVGTLIEGFDSSPYPFMGHNPPYYDALIGRAGFEKCKDLIAWDYDATRPVPEAAHQIADAVRQYPGLTVREIDPKQMEREVRIISEIFNSAWEKNWGFIPWTDAEIAKMAKDFKMILEPKLALIAEVNGVPAAMSIAIPNYHEAIRDLRGRLFPFGLLKLLYRLKTGKIRTARLALLGIKREFRHDVLAGLSVLLYAEMHKRSQMLKHRGGELSWTLEDNHKINHGIELMGGRPYKKYRIYEKKL